MLRTTTACTFSTSERQKLVRTRQSFTLLTWKFASRHNAVHYFNISTSESGLRMVCLVHFDLEMLFGIQQRALLNIATSKSGLNVVCFVHLDSEMCFGTQLRALSRHLNFQKSSEPVSFFTLLTKCASRQNNMQFLNISTSESGLRMVCFAHFDLEMCFAPHRRAIFHPSSGQMAPHPPL